MEIIYSVICNRVVPSFSVEKVSRAIMFFASLIVFFWARMRGLFTHAVF